MKRHTYEDCGHIVHSAGTPAKKCPMCAEPMSLHEAMQEYLNLKNFTVQRGLWPEYERTKKEIGL